MMGLLFCSRSGQECAYIHESVIKVIERDIIKHLPNETGGVLIGSYDANFRLATVHFALKAPSDSKHFTNSFHRGTNDVTKAIIKLKERKPGVHYLGEWHSHPFSKPTPSYPDIIQMQKFASRKQYGIRRPLLIIIGGSPLTQFDWHVSIHQKDRAHLNLHFM